MGSGISKPASVGIVIGLVILALLIWYGVARYREAREERDWHPIGHFHGIQGMEDRVRYDHRMPPINKPDDYQSIRSRMSSEGSQWPRPDRFYVVADRSQRHASRIIPQSRIAPLVGFRSREIDLEMGPLPEPVYLAPVQLEHTVERQLPVVNQEHYKPKFAEAKRLPPIVQKSNNPPPQLSESELRAYARECRHNARNSLELRAFPHPQRMHHTFLPRLRIPSLSGGAVEQISRVQTAAMKDLARKRPKPDDELSRSSRQRWFEDVWPSPPPFFSLPSDAQAWLREVLSQESGTNPCEVAWDFYMLWRRGTIFGVSAIDKSPSAGSSQAENNDENSFWPSPIEFPMSFYTPVSSPVSASGIASAHF